MLAVDENPCLSVCKQPILNNSGTIWLIDKVVQAAEDRQRFIARIGCNSIKRRD